MINSSLLSTSVLNCCFEFTKSRKKHAYISGIKSRDKLMKVKNPATILFGGKVRSVGGGCFMNRSLTFFASSLVA